MDISGSIKTVLPEQTGTGKNGTWKKQIIIIQTEGQYPKDVCITVWGEKVDKTLLQAGVAIRVYFDLESREFNGKWYTDVKGWKVEAIAGTSSSGNASADSDYCSESDLLVDDLPPF